MRKKSHLALAGFLIQGMDLSLIHISEIMIEDLYDKVNVILAKQSVLEKQLQIENHTNGKPKQE